MTHKDFLSEIYKNGYSFTTSEEDLLHQIFRNYRSTNSSRKGFQLSFFGKKLTDVMFNYHKFTFDKIEIKLKYLSFFDSHCHGPWFLDSKNLVVSDKTIAMAYQFYGDVENLTSNYS